MNRDEKNAFDAMMAEIESDSEDERRNNRTMPVRGIAKSESSQRSNSLYGADAKGSERPSSSSKYSNPSPPVTGRRTSQQTHTQAKLTKEELEIENFGSNFNQNPTDLQQEQLNTTKRWLARPCNRNERAMMKCYVERERSTFAMSTTYRCYLEGNDQQQQNGRFMMSAKKIVGKKTSYYLLSLEQDPTDDRGSETVIGKVRGNAVGSKYILTDHGVAPDKTVAPSMLRKELGIVSFVFDSGGPSQIEAWIPSVSTTGITSNWQPENDDCGMENAIDQKQFDRIFRLVNKSPKWDEQHGGHVLNFQGRVTESSVKNFQLCCQDSEDPEEVVLQFGRVGKNRFTMDLRFPLSPIQAFGICVTCLDGKIADRKGYEYLRRFSSTASAAATGSDSGSVDTTADGKASSSGGSSVRQVDGSMKGGNTSSISGMFREAIPSTQYLKDKWNRSFK